MRTLRIVVVATLFAVNGLLFLPYARACDGALCWTDSKGANVLSRDATKSTLAEEAAKIAKTKSVSLEYASVIHCPGNQPGGTTEVYCRSAMDFCPLYWPDSRGPFVAIWQRKRFSDGTPPTAWRAIGLTCYTDLVPAKPVLSLAQIRDAFHHTPFSKPGLRLQPKGALGT